MVGEHVGGTSAFGSLTATAVRVTFPRFVTVIAYVNTSPTRENDGSSATLTVATDGVCTPETVTGVEGLTTGEPVGGVAEPVATLTTEPASRSACLTRWLAVHTALAPGASESLGQTIDSGSACGSVTVTSCIVTLPELRTMIV